MTPKQFVEKYVDPPLIKDVNSRGHQKLRMMKDLAKVTASFIEISHRSARADAFHEAAKLATDKGEVALAAELTKLEAAAIKGLDLRECNPNPDEPA
jgi:isopropylmalate/homocitrate/citramalate synthase